jgi:DNA-directed RNA polymerase subunit RPC12/RpoP
LKHKKLECSNCGYHNEFQVGATELSSTLSDLNEEYSNFKLFRCSEEKEFHSLDIMDPDFNNTCPIHGAELEEIKDDEEMICPVCGSKLEASEHDWEEHKKEE